MKINFARSMDHWFGIPICFVLSVFCRIKKFFIPERFEKIKPKKIMFLELSEMGSAILAYSAIKKTKEMYPQAKLYFWIFKENQDSVHILDIIPKENVIVMRSNNFSSLIIDTIKNLWRVRREKIDVLIDMELFSRFSSALSYLSGAKIRVGFHRFSAEGLYRGNLQTHKVSYNPYMHISKDFLALVNSLKANSQNVPLLKESITNSETIVPKVKSSEEVKENIFRKLKEFNGQISKESKLIVLNPGINETLPLRKWPIKNYIELSKKLLINPSVFVIIVGVESKVLGNGEVMHQEISNSRFINLIGKTSVKELICLYNISTLLISHDSGAVNLASLTEINIVVLFGPETPSLYAPLTSKKIVLYSNLACSPCITAYNHRHSQCRDNQCLKRITVEEVYKSAERYI